DYYCQSYESSNMLF
nr:immunoglobulin light chain junction region [Macaca mulatta]MOX17502.1 immunoglobulin light chain junction region [Macaca mulatta]MOX17826.1 immunoglobulin light chain junction region [Macaca mulatta]MOX17977.1 immunoglobulin light chain junction region [Macaca mulatta]MOX18075.1 immunoglobulin light chain junction region [Macaca mulatta]